MRNILRDKSRDKLTQELNSLGVKAEMAGRGRPEEGIRRGLQMFQLFGRTSLGIIDIRDNGLIKWINVVRIKRRDRHGPARYRVVFGIPDETIPINHVQLKITTVRKKAFPLFGNVIDVYWEGKGVLQPLVKVFSDDGEIDELVKDLGDMSVYTHPNKFQGWTLDVGSIFTPTAPRWNTFQKIANILISFPRS